MLFQLPFSTLQLHKCDQLHTKIYPHGIYMAFYTVITTIGMLFTKSVMPLFCLCHLRVEIGFTDICENGTRIPFFYAAPHTFYTYILNCVLYVPRFNEIILLIYMSCVHCATQWGGCFGCSQRYRRSVSSGCTLKCTMMFRLQCLKYAS